jgi:hypothetical protein
MAHDETLDLQRWMDDGGSAGEGDPAPVNRRQASRVGGLLVVTGYGEERLGYLAVLLSESLPRALWASPPESHDSEREIQLALTHLSCGTSVVQVVETDCLVSRFRGLAERTGARFLLVRVLPPLASGEAPGLPAGLDADGPHGPCVRVRTSASLATQFEVVLEAWNCQGKAP